MRIETPRVRSLLKAFEFPTLFREQLGWDNYKAELEIPVDGTRYSLCAVAEKRGFVAYTCSTIPDRATRLKIDHQVTKSVREHLVVYTDQPKGQQVWHWVRREAGRPLASRDHRYDASQTGDPLIQKLETLAFSLEEEEKLTIVDIAGRVRTALDVDRITKRFYDRFKSEHAAFLKLIKGIGSDPDLQWYTSLMLNRLMFVYFIQKKGFLDSDVDYLRNRLKRTQAERGKDKFHTFYRYFLLRLFHDGLGKAPADRDATLEKLLGKVPYLNGGFFEIHPLESAYPGIDIPDKAFEKLFDFFDAYQWHLDERPLRADNEINPDVVGYIFEKYINQKQMGAYYTKEDITEYISKNTIIPFLFDAAEKKCAIAFKPDGAVWRLLRDDPDRYIYDAVRKGVIRPSSSAGAEGRGPGDDIIPLPRAIAAGLKDVTNRGGWNRPADPEYALPTETWREHVARRNRCLEIREKLRKGEIHSINDLITLNLDIRQFAQDVIANSEGPELLRAFFHAMEGVSVLDPTCGSGAFLFAALNILEPLYEACLDRMQAFVEDLDRSGRKHHPEKFSDFRQVLGQIDQHPSGRYFVLKAIIINNLYGVDIMEEAVEICKLRLFLKLVAQIDRVQDIEPLPDIDFNIRAGNTLVGFTSIDEVRKSQEGKLGFAAKDIARIEEHAELADKAFQMFRQMQTKHGMEGKKFAQAKIELRRRLDALDAELDRYLAGEYGIEADSSKQRAVFDKWKTCHQPFHWFVEFFGIIKRGGFDVIIGNPPYVVYTGGNTGYELKAAHYKTFSTKNLYAFVFERALSLSKCRSPVGLIVQLTSLSSERLLPLQNLLLQRGFLYAVSFPRRPESVFEGVEMPVAILLSIPGTPGCIITSRVNRFYTEERSDAIDSLHLTQHHTRLHGHRIAKFGTDLESHILSKLMTCRDQLDSLSDARGKGLLYYQEACRYWLKAFNQLPFFSRNGTRMDPPHGRIIRFQSTDAASFASCVLNSSLFYWYYTAFSDCEHVNDVLVRTFPKPASLGLQQYGQLANRLMRRLEETCERKTIKTKQGHTITYDEMKAVYAKETIDEVDAALAVEYGLTAEECAFLQNYDIKYRCGDSTQEDE